MAVDFRFKTSIVILLPNIIYQNFIKIPFILYIFIATHYILNVRNTTQTVKLKISNGRTYLQSKITNFVKLRSIITWIVPLTAEIRWLWSSCSMIHFANNFQKRNGCFKISFSKIICHLIFAIIISNSKRRYANIYNYVMEIYNYREEIYKNWEEFSECYLEVFSLSIMTPIFELIPA